MNPLLYTALGSILRWLLAIGAGYLVKAGIWNSTDAEKYIAAGAIAVLTLGWSLWQKYHSRIRFLTALAMPSGSTENDTNTQIIAKVTPSISTPVNEVPINIVK
jgi:hypothetical protein